MISSHFWEKYKKCDVSLFMFYWKICVWRGAEKVIPPKIFTQE